MILFLPTLEELRWNFEVQSERFKLESESLILTYEQLPLPVTRPKSLRESEMSGIQVILYLSAL